jgi:hypothetical protein
LSLEHVSARRPNCRNDCREAPEVTSSLQERQQRDSAVTTTLGHLNNDIRKNSNKPDGFEHRDPDILLSNVPRDVYDSAASSRLSILSERLDEIDFDGLSFKEQYALDDVSSYCTNRSIIRGIEGNVGLAPATASPGDVIAALLGCPSVMILRQLENGRYKVIGETLYQGFHYGEGFLGPLPDFVEPIQYSDKEGLNWWVFKNQDTGEFLLRDPRLGDLPVEWKKEEYDDERRFFSLFVNKRTGEILENRDPRMRSDALKERGVALKVFELV